MEKDKQSWPWDESEAEEISQLEREQELSAEDLAIIKAFEEMDDSTWQKNQAEPLTAPVVSLPTEETLDDMLIIFVDEVEEDIARINRALNQLEQQEGASIDSARLVTVKRAAHKIRGSAGMVECGNLSAIAHSLEEIGERVLAGHVEPSLALKALIQGAQAMEATLDGFVQHGHESVGPREIFEQNIRGLHILDEDAETFEESDEITLERELKREVLPASPLNAPSLPRDLLVGPDSSSPAMVRFEQRRFEQLQQHSEGLMGQRMPLEQAQEQVASALQELQAAQMRLQLLEPRLSGSLLPGIDENMPAREYLSSSSLIRRILHEKQTQQDSQEEHGPLALPDARSQRQFMQPGRLGFGAVHWDELNMERYSEKDMLLRSFREAVTDVSVASTRVQSAIDRYNQVISECLQQATNIRNDLRLLRLAPLSVILPRLRQALQWYSSEQVQFDVFGEALEVDQEVLATLTEPLVQLLHSCVRDALVESEELRSRHDDEQYRVWLHATRAGSELELEVGFSRAVQGGALTLIYEPVQRLSGTVMLERNKQGGVSFHIRLPISRGSTRCLLVRCDKEVVVVPFSQIQHIGENTSEEFDLKFDLNDLLNISTISRSTEVRKPATRVQTVLVLPRWGSHRVSGIVVDEIIGEAEFVIKPLPAYLRRPGLAGTAIDGRERILLVLDLPELISAYALQPRIESREPVQDQVSSQHQPQEPRILIADDSVSMRLSLRQTLSHAHYTVLEASDGLEAFELLQTHVPDVLLLDIEMPNLNGYDLLNLMRLRPELATVKTIMLTSRSSELHMKHALELGAYGYLTKPCPLETLLKKVQEALGQGTRSVV
ncbi:response regulator [Ktedonospora formicarum]|uniref:histidine kinase n=1 Tax=Ktedonospora formicarum TaxID=2778364 RepID=A0A8J3HW25_9CHLR|nr:response regulator [Ktedonospora formicarum]GHO44286.1 hypothetical protein KSX_24490 [Ktedonospora formicarum]